MAAELTATGRFVEGDFETDAETVQLGERWWFRLTFQFSEETTFSTTLTSSVPVGFLYDQLFVKAGDDWIDISNMIHNGGELPVTTESGADDSEITLIFSGLSAATGLGSLSAAFSWDVPAP